MLQKVTILRKTSLTFYFKDTSSPETAVRALVNYIYSGKLEVSSMSIKNVAVLGAYLEMEQLLEQLPDMAIQLGVDDFNLEQLKTIGQGLPDMTVDGLKKFVEAGFGTTTKMRTGDKRKNQPTKKKEPPKKQPKVLFILYRTFISEIAWLFLKA